MMNYPNYPLYPNNNYLQTQPIQQPMQPNNDERIWVQGYNSAEAYLVAPNSFVRLWDSTVNRFYEKRADATGRPFSLDVYEYKRIEPQTAPVVSDSAIDYQEQFKRLDERISALEGNIKKEGKKNEPKSNAKDTGIPEI